MYICNGCDAVYNEEALNAHPNDAFKVCPQWKCQSYMTKIDEDLVPIAKALKKKGYLFNGSSYGEQKYPVVISLRFTTILNMNVFTDPDNRDRKIQEYFFGGNMNGEIEYDDEATYTIDFDVKVTIGGPEMTFNRIFPYPDFKYYSRALESLISVVRSLPDLSDEYLQGIPICNLLS